MQFVNAGDGFDSSRPGTPLARSRLLGQPGSRPGTPLARLQQQQQQHQANALHPKHPILTPQQFYDWLALIDRSVAHSQESHFRAHVADVAEHLEACDRLVDVIDGVEREVDGMMQGWVGVEESGKSLKDACERLLDERVGVIFSSLESASLTYSLSAGYAVEVDR